MRYVLARRRQISNDETYRIYVTDALYALVNGGQTLTKRFFEIMHPAREDATDEKNPEEIKHNIVEGLRGLTE